METATDSSEPIASSSRRFARRLLTIGENRIELLLVEVQEERERLLHAFLLGLGVAALGLLAALTLTAAIVVWLWACSPVAVLLALTGLYGGPEFGLAGNSPDGCVIGGRFPPPSINFERTAHVWKKPSNESAGVTEATFDCRKRT